VSETESEVSGLRAAHSLMPLGPLQFNRTFFSRADKSNTTSLPYRGEENLA